LDDEGLACSAVMLGRGESQVLQRVALKDAANPRRVALSAAGAQWARFEGGPGGGCPWSKWNAAGDYNRVSVTSGATLTWVFTKKSDNGGPGCGGPGQPPCP